MTHRILVSAEAQANLAALELKIQRRIYNKLIFYGKAADPLSFSKPLSGKLRGLYRFRIGDYRAIFRVLPNGEITILFVLRIEHRSHVYE